MRKLLMITSTWNNTYVDHLLQGILRRIQNTDIHLDFFNAYDVISQSEYGQMELEIFRLPDPREYEGMLVSVNSVKDISYINQVIANYLEHGCKVLCIDQQFYNQPCIGIDNYQMFYQMVEHMITVHGCREMNYLGGPENHKENRLRYAAFCDCMAHYQLPIDPERVLHLRFLHSDGEAAYDLWKKRGLHLPDAVLCANDFMALGYCVAAQRDGLHAPDDFRISGFDNLDDGQYYSPSITSINRNWKQLGYDSMSRLLEMIDGRSDEALYYTEGICVYNESCGCAKALSNIRQSLLCMYQEKKSVEYHNIIHHASQQMLCSASIGPQLPEILSQCCNQLSLSALALYLHPVAEDEEDSRVDIYTDTGMDTVTSLLPDSWTSREECRICVFSPLHFQDQNMGYCVIPYSDGLFLHDKHRKFSDNLSLALSLISQQKKLQQMNLQLQQLYIRDQLTGLYNRFGYEDMANAYYQQQQGRVYVIFLDVDNLKGINDQYGHAIGDLAIRGVAEAINAILSQAPVKVRMGGDEFLVIGPYTDETALLSLEQELQQWLVEYSALHRLPFTLKASTGHVWNTSAETSLEHLVQEADNRMYACKKSRKK